MQEKMRFFCEYRYFVTKIFVPLQQNNQIMKYRYQTSGTCSQMIEFEIENDVIMSVQFIGGCMGNTQGIASLVRGMKVDDVIAKLEGILCGSKGTSCPDQLARALKAWKNSH